MDEPLRDEHGDAAEGAGNDAGDGADSRGGTSRMADPRDAAPAARPAGKSFVRRHWLAVTILALVALPSVGVGIWTAIALSWSYSEGTRAGYVQKISRKGWLCKTWEGVLYTDIARGFRSDSFSFSVRSDSIARVLGDLSGKRVTVTYQQHVGVPTTCFGETEYYVVAVKPSPE